MRIFLRLDGDGVATFLVEEPEVVSDGSAEPVGVRGKAEAWFRSIKGAWHRSESLAAKTARRLWTGLNHWISDDEDALGRLHTADRIEIVHSPSMTEAEARSAWDRMIRRGCRRHLPWFVANLLIAPLTIPIAVVPGPNVVGYWFVYRAWQDGRALLGVRRAWKGGREITFRPESTEGTALPAPAVPDHATGSRP